METMTPGSVAMSSISQCSSLLELLRDPVRLQTTVDSLKAAAAQHDKAAAQARDALAQVDRVKAAADDREQQLRAGEIELAAHLKEHETAAAQFVQKSKTAVAQSEKERSEIEQARRQLIQERGEFEKAKQVYDGQVLAARELLAARQREFDSRSTARKSELDRRETQIAGRESAIAKRLNKLNAVLRPV